MRVRSIDILRSAAMVIMAVVHFCENLAGYTPVIGGLGAPLFMFLSGVNYQLWLTSQRKRNRDEREILKVTIRRGLFLFGLGFAFNILVWSPKDVFNWDILTLIGTGLIVLGMARNFPPIVLVVFSLGLIFLMPIMMKLADWQAFWTEGYFSPDMTYSGVLLGFIVTGYFPVVPYLAFPLLGFTVATDEFVTRPLHTLVPQVSSNPSIRNWNMAVGNFAKLGMVLVALVMLMVLIRYCLPVNFQSALPVVWSTLPPSLEYLLIAISFPILAFITLYRWLDQSDRIQDQPFWFEFFSKYSLSFYLLHHIVHLWPLWIAGVIWSEHPQDYWQKATTVPVAIMLSLLFLVLSFFLLRLIDRYQWPSVEKLMRWLCD